jgi:flagellar biosynthesis chaperone FliJ
MRVLKLTNEQVELLTIALGIAEKNYLDVQKKLVDLATIRNNPQKATQVQLAMIQYDYACKFCDLNIDINNGKFDV